MVIAMDMAMVVMANQTDTETRVATMEQAFEKMVKDWT